MCACCLVKHAVISTLLENDITLTHYWDHIVVFFVSVPDAIPSADQVRITPSLRSQKGSVWTKNRVDFEHWEAEVTFRVSGRGRMGADGLVRRPETSVLLIEAVVGVCLHK